MSQKEIREKLKEGVISKRSGLTKKKLFEAGGCECKQGEKKQKKMNKLMSQK